MIRSIFAVIVGYAVWTALWLVGNARFFSEAAEVVGGGEPYTEAGPLAGAIGLCLVCSLVAGFVCALLAGRRRGGAVLLLAVLLLLTGIGVQASVWSQMPRWYHLTFIALLLPSTIVGGRLAPGGPRSETD